MSENVADETVNAQNGSSTLAWFLVGVTIGATAALLYAPKSGKDTRDFLSQKTQEGKKAVEDASRDVVENSREMFERGRRLVEDAADLFERGRKMVRG
jgi:gas vesicle protein